MSSPAAVAAQDSPLLRAERVSRTYVDGSVAALRDVSLSIAREEYVAVMGPSGSGKSTLLNLLGALDVPTEGEIYFQEQPLSKMRSLDRFRAHHIGFVFQSFHLLPTLTAVENVQIPMFEGPLSAKGRREKAYALLDAVGMRPRAEHLPTQLSVGERQRVTIARSLANDPSVVLADEPTGNLDTQSGGEVLDLFDSLRTRFGTTLVVITHSAEVAARAGRAVRIRDGRIESDCAARGV